MWIGHGYNELARAVLEKLPRIHLLGEMWTFKKKELGFDFIWIVLERFRDSRPPMTHSRLSKKSTSSIPGYSFGLGVRSSHYIFFLQWGFQEISFFIPGRIGSVSVGDLR